MKNILKKLLLLFVVGMLGQTYIDNTCWASKQTQLPFGFELKEFDFETIETFNPNNFWTARTYAPCLDSGNFNHSSRCALALVSNKDKKDKKAYVKFFDGNFIARGNNFEQNKSKCKKCIKCKHNKSGFTTPRVHSEIAFLQELTKNTNPNKITGITFLTKFGKYETSERIIILIRNSYYIPCYWGDDPGYICMNYIADFCKKLKELTSKKITCIVQYEKDYPNFAEKRKEEEMKEEEMKKQKNMIISKINSDENHITEIENFYGRKAIIYCY